MATDENIPSPNSCRRRRVGARHRGRVQWSIALRWKYSVRLVVFWYYTVCIYGTQGEARQNHKSCIIISIFVPSFISWFIITGSRGEYIDFYLDSFSLYSLVSSLPLWILDNIWWCLCLLQVLVMVYFPN